MMKPQLASPTRTLRFLIFVVAVCVFVGGCASSGDVQQRQDAVDSSGSVLAIPESVDSASSVVEEVSETSDASPFVIRKASGYLRELLDSTHGPEDVMIAFREGPNHTLDTSDFVVAGYLFEIVPGVTIVDTSRGQTMTAAEQQAMSAIADELEARHRTEGATEGDWQELQRMRDNISQNRPRRQSVQYFWAYRIRITDVIKGSFSDDDIIEIQVYAGTNLDTELSAQVLEGTPRVVVGGKPGGPSVSSYELRDSEGETVDQVNWSFPDLFWFDEGVWEILVDDSSNGVSVTEESDGTTTLPNELLQDDTPEINTGALEEGSEESPAEQLLVAESHYLSGLHEMHSFWGELNSLDDLAEALRGVASTATTPSTTTVAPTTTAPTTTTTVASTTTESLQP